MKNQIAVIFLILVTILFAQKNEVEQKLAWLKLNGNVKVTEIEKDIVRIEYPNGKTKVKYISEYVQKETSINKTATFETTTIDLRTIDTTLYHQKYKFWQEVNISNDSDPLIIADINRNGLPEIYGIQKEYYGKYSDVTVMEINEEGKFNKVFSYDSTQEILSISDVDKNGLKEVNLRRRFTEEVPDTNLLNSWWQQLYYEQHNSTSLAEDLSFIFEPRQALDQQKDHIFGDWDGDDYTDQIFVNLTTYSSIDIYEYNPVANNFDSVYKYDFDSQNFYYRGFAKGDFDEDGKTEFFAGSIKGKIIAIENNGDNDYRLSWQGMVETYNAYLFTQANDLDGNGKKEIWSGGDATYNGVGVTRITLFEANGNDNYEAVGRIDLVGVFSFWAGNFQTIDVDKDGKEEVMICIDGNVLILKFNGSQNHQTYEVFYIKQDHLFNRGRSTVFFGAVLYDITNDGNEEIVINMDEVEYNLPDPQRRFFSLIYKPDFTVGIDDGDSQLPTEFKLNQNYPNPFNPATAISYNLPQKSFVAIRAYNMLGEEVAVLKNAEQATGEYTVEFNAERLPSGVYIINMNAGNYNKSIKAVLLK